MNYWTLLVTQGQWDVAPDTETVGFILQNLLILGQLVKESKGFSKGNLISTGITLNKTLGCNLT